VNAPFAYRLRTKCSQLPLPSWSPSPQKISSRISTPPSERYRAKGKHRTLRSELRQSLSLHSGAVDQLQNELDCFSGDTPTSIADSWEDWNAGVIECAEARAEENTIPRLWLSTSPSLCSSAATKLAIPSTQRLYPHLDIPIMNYSTQSSLPLPFSRPISQRRGLPVRKKHLRKVKIATTTEGRASPGVALQSAADDDLFEVVMLSAIKANTELYHKVLRYEPVGFSVFLDLAIGQDLPTKRLVYKLRTFLDRQVSLPCLSASRSSIRSTDYSFLWSF
jgi:hypothetical protein